MPLVVAMSQADTLWELQAVDADGLGTHPLVGAAPDPGNRVTVEGVALAGVGELLDPAVMYTALIQDNLSHRGGLQAWAGSWWSIWNSTRTGPGA